MNDGGWRWRMEMEDGGLRMEDGGWRTENKGWGLDTGGLRTKGGEDAGKMSRARRDFGLDSPCSFAEPS